MNVLILGGGGREHAFAWKISQSSLCKKLLIAPGNAGTAQVGTNIKIGVNEFKEIKKLCISEEIDMLIVGPEDPLVNGIYDFFHEDEALQNITVVGPSKKGAQLEGSKEFSKRFMMKYGIPTATYQSFTKETLEEGYQFLETLSPPYVLKADGLAAGKGVLILKTLKEAKLNLKEMLAESKFGDASSKVVIEEHLKGIELSVFVLTDGVSYKILPSAKDYKRIGEGDTGLNTGGMGAISPPPFLNEDIKTKIEERIICPTIKGFALDRLDYSGFVFFGLILVDEDPYVIEYNCRLGDPETEVILPRLKSDIIELFDGIATDTLSERDIEIDLRSASTVMLVSGGYPEDYEKGKEITIGDVDDKTLLFHAGTSYKNNKVVSSGGRVITVTSYGKNLETALQNSYNNLAKVSFEKAVYREDIGKDLLKKK